MKAVRQKQRVKLRRRSIILASEVLTDEIKRILLKLTRYDFAMVKCKERR